MKPGETIALGWVDNQNVYGAFMQAVLETVFFSMNTQNKITRIYRGSGLHIGDNRDGVAKQFIKDNDTDWLLWVDSDILIKPSNLQMFIEHADANSMPLLSGIYFLSIDRRVNGLFANPVPSIFTEKQYEVNSNSFVEIDWSGLGLTIVHRSVINKIVEKYGIDRPIHEMIGGVRDFVGEDYAFFNKAKSVGFTPHAHTSIIAQHMKLIGIGIREYLNQV